MGERHKPNHSTWKWQYYATKKTTEERKKVKAKLSRPRPHMNSLSGTLNSQALWKGILIVKLPPFPTLPPSKRYPIPGILFNIPQNSPYYLGQVWHKVVQDKKKDEKHAICFCLSCIWSISISCVSSLQWCQLYPTFFNSGKRRCSGGTGCTACYATRDAIYLRDEGSTWYSILL